MSDIDWRDRAGAVDFQVRDFIDGGYREVGGDEVIEKRSGRDGSLLYEFGAGTVAGVDGAVASGKAAFDSGVWSQMPVGGRRAVLMKLADLIVEHKEELALYECLDVGKPISNALGDDIPRAVGAIRSAAEGAERLFAISSGDGPGPNFSFQLRKPIGVVGGIVGWNYPLLLAATKVGPALAMGNSLVLKPSEFTSLSAGRLAELAVEAGVPAGVFNVVHGAGRTVGDRLARHPDVGLISFTGSSVTGKQMMISAGESNMKRLILECGGKSPYLIFDDCPDDGPNGLDAIALDIVQTAFPNQGAVCSSVTRLLLQEGIREKLLPKILKLTAEITPADPLDAATSFGAIINEAHMTKVLGYVDSGISQGATLLYGGDRVNQETGGYYLRPAIFDQVKPDHKIAREETFGPLLSIFTFKDEAEAIKLANDTSFGLAAYAATRDLGRAHRLAQKLEAGVIVIASTSAPKSFGLADIGVEAQKESGFGYEGGFAGLAAYTVSSGVHFLM